MQQKDAKSLWNKYKAGQTTANEKEFIEGFILTEAKDASPLTQQEIKEDLASLQYRINKIPKEKLTSRYVMYYAAAASIFLCLAFAVYFVLSPTQVTERFANDILPGNNKAYLILANGIKINLNDAKKGEILSLPGIKIKKTDDGQLIYELDQSGKSEEQKGINTIVTPKGGQHQIILPDGSKVWLNASSTLKFSTSLAQDMQRTVILNGEGYFEIKKDKKHPFIVRGKDQIIRVLGTHFNVSDYPDEKTVKTTLLEGSVSLTTISNTQQRIILKPNQQAVNNHKNLALSAVDVDNVIAWKNGEFDFNNESLESILRKISRWYDVRIIYQDNELKTKVFWGTASRYTNVSDVLSLLELTGQVKFQIKGKEITVMK